MIGCGYWFIMAAQEGRIWEHWGRFLYSYSTSIVGCYLVMVFSARHLMKLFRPLRLHRLLVAHNVVCCVLSAVTLWLLGRGLWETGTIVKLSTTSPYFARGLHIYWLTKYYELLDTVFMLLRHKKRQISFLHVFHHSSMPFLSEYGYRYAPWPPVAFGLMLNSVVHVVMYSYYAMTAIFPLHDFTWKRFITQLQIAQFLLGIVVSTYGYLHEGYCIYSIMYTGALICLFSKYYYKAFIARSGEKKERQD